jgi:hypothetical protein
MEELILGSKKLWFKEVHLLGNPMQLSQFLRNHIKYSVYLCNQPTCELKEKDERRLLRRWLLEWEKHCGVLFLEPSPHIDEDLISTIRRTDFVIAIGPGRYDIEITLAERLGKNTMYYDVRQTLSPNQINKAMLSLPSYPYHSYYVNGYYISSIVDALGHFISFNRIIPKQGSDEQEWFEQQNW